jgi:hypothetical protein
VRFYLPEDDRIKIEPVKKDTIGISNMIRTEVGGNDKKQIQIDKSKAQLKLKLKNQYKKLSKLKKI